MTMVYPARCGPAHSDIMGSKGTPDTGSALILALWTLFFLGSLALAVGAHVSANLRLAGRVKTGNTAHYLARGGVERAVFDVIVNATNWDGVTDEDLNSDELIFKDNDSLDGGAFSVMYAFVPTNTGVVSTNYGVVTERRRIDVNRSSQRTVALALAERVEEIDEKTAFAVAKAIVDYRNKKSDTQKELTGKPGKGNFEHSRELLLVPGIGPEVFAQIRPHVTIYGKSCFRGTAEGRALAGQADAEKVVVDTCRIDFVFDSGESRFVYWREY